ncbi:DUF1223 domain-containing protein [Lysobacter cavernae]|uniref:DUF1223 domain-containing protein n=1 Tax=Lysobacter cavernae TaxID=1685901 RepID=A0ABV7RQ44_9GAMM
MTRSIGLMCAGWLLVAAPGAAAEHCQARSGTQTVPLVELYTSQGCNGCPPAEKWLDRFIESEDPAKTAVLALHVDYWDDLGWRDLFGAKLHSQRQNARVAMAKGKVVVTPQVMIGKEVNVNWRSGSRVDAVLEQVRAQPAAVDLAIQSRTQDQTVHVDFTAIRNAGPSGTEPAYVWLALYEDGLSSAIREGENKGKTLRHERVVRALKGPWELDARPIAGDAQIALPDRADPAQMGVVLFAESRANGASLQTLQVPLASCLQ